MKKSDYRCPINGCPGVLYHKCICKTCFFDVRDVVANPDTSDARIMAALKAGWLVEDTGKKTLLLLSQEGDKDYEMPWRGAEEKQINELRELLLTDGNFSTVLTAGRVRQFLSGCARKTATELDIKGFTERGDHPQLYLDKENDQLFWPFQPGTCTTPWCRVVGGLYYTGPLYAPTHNGAFEELLSTVRCRSEGDRDVLRGWMLGSMLTRIIGVGGTRPMLVLSANTHSVGKTTTATLIGRLLGGFIQVDWGERREREDLKRQIMDPGCRLLTLDNCVPDEGPVFESSALSNLVTAEQLSTKIFYQSTGALKRENCVLYAMTMNIPYLACDLLARAVICELSPAAPLTENWLKHWCERRQEVLQDMMAICIDGWAKGPVSFPSRTRFLDWWNVVSRVLQRPPTTVPDGCTVRSPVDLALDELFDKDQKRKRLRLVDFMAWCAEAHHGMAAHVAKQSRDPERIVTELGNYQGHYEVIEENGAQWIRKRGSQD